MKKSEYIENEHVIGFVNFINTRLESGNSTTHSYVLRRENKVWSCNNVYDAYCKYQWKFTYNENGAANRSGSSYIENEKALSDLSLELRNCYHTRNESGLRDTSCRIFRWGGVSNGNSRWAIEMAKRAELSKEYYRGIILLSPAHADDELVSFNDLRFNAGLTKIYSLLLDDFIIYDSRVGGALGWLVAQYCQNQGLETVPDFLGFPWAPAKEGSNQTNPKNRDPSTLNYNFPSFSANSQMHARWNIRASWLIAELIKHSGLFIKLNHPMRAMEAALFMIGYDIPKQTKGISHSIHHTNFITEENTSPNSSFPFVTKSRQLRFRVDIQKNSIKISYETRKNGTKRSPDTFTFDEIYKIVNKLHEWFSLKDFPLGNNVQKLGNGTEINGLGLAILNTGRNVTSAQASSYLGPFLEEAGIFSQGNFITNRRSITSWRLTKEPSIEDIKSAIFDLIQCE